MHPEVLMEMATTAMAHATATEAAHASPIHIALAAEKLGSFLGLPITNTLITSWIVMALLVSIAWYVGSRVSLVPGRLQTLFETAFSYIYDYIAETLESRDMARTFFPLLVTMFLFVFTANLLEFTPGIGSIYYGEDHAPLLRSVNTDLNVTLALAIIAFFTIEITGIMALGAVKYGSKFITFKSPIAFAIGIIELFSEMARLVSFSFRLFGNIFAGEVLILVITYFVPYFLPVPLMLFEVFVGFIQATIFALLTLFFIKLAVAEPEHAH